MVGYRRTKREPDCSADEDAVRRAELKLILALQEQNSLEEYKRQGHPSFPERPGSSTWREKR